MHDSQAAATVVATSPAGRVGGVAAPPPEAARAPVSRNLLRLAIRRIGRGASTPTPAYASAPGGATDPGCPARGCRDTTTLLEHLDGYEAAQCIAAGGAVLALAGGCAAYGVALAFVVFLCRELALPHPRQGAHPVAAGHAAAVLPITEGARGRRVPEIEEQPSSAPRRRATPYWTTPIADLGRSRSGPPQERRGAGGGATAGPRLTTSNSYNSPCSRAQSHRLRALARCRASAAARRSHQTAVRARAGAMARRGSRGRGRCPCASYAGSRRGLVRSKAQWRRAGGADP